MQIKRTYIKWSFTADTIAFAECTAPGTQLLESCSLEDCANHIVSWLQVVNSMASRIAKISTSSICNSWYTSDLHNMKSLLDASPLHSVERKKLRNTYTKAVRRAKRSHERTQARSLKGGIWDVIKRKKGSSNDSDWSIDINGVTTQDSSLIANSFRNMFVETVEKLSSTATPEPLVNVVPQAASNWDLVPCSVQDIAVVIDKLKYNASCGPDKIPSRLIKELKHPLLPPLCTLTNRCIDEGIFPDCFKVGKVVPIPKRGSRKILSNYRPITITSIVGKIVESAINKQLSHAIDKYLPSTCFGFRKNMGTSDALIHLKNVALMGSLSLF